MRKTKVCVLLSCFVLMTGCSNFDEFIKQQEEKEKMLNTANSLDENSIVSEEIIEGNVAPISGGTLNMSMRVPKTLNPLQNGDVTVDNCLKLIFEPLFMLDEEQRAVPVIASGYFLSEDGLTLTINLKQDLTWEDGQSITADDVVYSLSTIENSSSSLYKSALENVTSYKAENSNTVIIKYTKSSGTIMYKLCIPIIPKHYYSLKNQDNSFVPMGSGVYKFVSYREARELNLEKRANFRGTPYIDNVKILITDSKETDINAFEQGLTDIISVDITEYGKLSTDKKIKATKFDTNNFEFLGFNFNNPIIQNVNVRRAVAESIPIEEITDTIYLSNMVKSIVPVNPNSWLSAQNEIPEYAQDLINARNLIKDVPKENLNFRILVNEENSERVKVANLIAENLNQIGMKITVIQEPFETYTSMIETGNFDLYIGGVYFSDTPDLNILLSSSARVNKGLNYMNFSDTQMDLLLSNAYSVVGEEEFKLSMIEMQKYCQQQMPLIGFGFKNEIVLSDAMVYGNSKQTNDYIYGIIDWFIKR